MNYSKSIAIVLTTAVCAIACAVDAGAQSRGRSSGGRGPTAGRAVPRSDGPRTQAPRSPGARTQSPRGDGRGYDSRGGSPRVIGRAPLRSYYYPNYSYGYRRGLTIGLGLYGYPYYGYDGYGYPYGAYGYSYGGYYPSGYGYGGYGYGSYAAPRSGYAGAAYGGGIRIQGAPRDAQVYVDGYYAGIVDDYDGTFQRLELEEGPHEVEIRTAGGPLAYDVNVTPGQTLTIHANVR